MGTSGPTPLPIVPATEAVMKRLDVREGYHLALKDHVSCSVSFAQGAETAAMFAVHGIPEVCTCPLILFSIQSPEPNVESRSRHVQSCLLAQISRDCPL